MFANFTEETCTGAGDILALAGATAGNILFSSSFADGDLVAYVVEDSGGTIKVSGVGTYTLSTDDITRKDTWSWDGTSIDNAPAANIALSGGTHTIRCAPMDVRFHQQENIVDSSLAFYHPDNFTAYGTNSAKGGGAFTSAAGRIAARPIFFRSRTTVATLGSEIVTVSAGGSFAMAIYGGNGDLKNDALLVESGNIATDASGVVSATLGSSIILDAGWYWLLVKVDNTVAEFMGARPSRGNMLQSPLGSLTAEGGDSGSISYWDTTYIDAFLSSIAAYGARAGVTKWETPELIYS